MKSDKQVIQELQAEKISIYEKNQKATQMINSHRLSSAQQNLLSAQVAAYEVVTRMLSARINLLQANIDIQEDVESEKKYNVIALKDPQGKAPSKFWYRNSLDKSVSVDSDNFNGDDDQQWTMKQIKDYGLENYERVEVIE